MSLYKHWMMVCVESKPTTAEVYRVLTGTERRQQWGESSQVQGLHKCWKRWQQMACMLWVNPQQQTGSRQQALRLSWWWRVMSWQRAPSMAESKCGRKSALKLAHVVSKPTTAQLYCWVFGSGVVVESRRQCWLREKKKKADKWGHMTWSSALHRHCCSPLPPPPPTPPLFTTTTTAALQHHHCTCPHLQCATTD